MTSLTLLHLLVILHITGFTTMAGTVIAEFSVNRKLNKYLTSDKVKALTILEGTSRFPALIGIGVGLLILTGIGMVIVYKGSVAHMLWFRIKMILVLVAMIIGGGVMRKNNVNLRLLLAENTGHSNSRILAIKGRLTALHVVQLLIILTIFTLSVFRF